MEGEAGYTVLSRRWRPQSFDEVVGQKHVTETLKKAVESGRVAHAYLFSGPRGVGKTTVARVLAKAMNCAEGPTAIPCGKCASCVDIRSGRSMDVIEIDAASNRGIDDVRDLREKVRYTSMSGKHKIYIVDEVHMLTDAAFNALLKTLEEPPAGVIFVLATTEPHKVPATIHSRCQRFDFRRISDREMAERISGIADTEGIRIAPEAISLLCSNAEGSMRDAESMLDQLLSSSEGEITLARTSEILGLPERGVFRKLITACANGDTKLSLEILGDCLDRGLDVKEIFIGLGDYLRDLIFAKVGSSVDDIMDGEELRELSSSFEEADLIRLLKILNDSQLSARGSSKPRLHLELALVRMSKLDKTVELDNLIREISRAGSSGGQLKSSRKPESKARSVEEETGKLDFSSFKDSWPMVMENLRSEKPPLAAWLGDAWPEAFDNGRLIVGFSQEQALHKDFVDSADNRAAITSAIETVTGKGVSVLCRCVTGSVGQKPKRKKKLGEELQDDPTVKTMLEIFEGEIIEVRTLEELT
jgi:DNA polymerase-3 subunit gamma/tau